MKFQYWFVVLQVDDMVLEMPAVLRAMRAGITYVNVHSDIFPGGEIRGQLSFVAHDFPADRRALD